MLGEARHLTNKVSDLEGFNIWMRYLKQPENQQKVGGNIKEGLKAQTHVIGSKRPCSLLVLLLY